MSHWTKVKLKITDKDTLAAALKRMGAKTVHMEQRKITQYGTTETADIWLDSAVGFKQEADGTFSMIGDFYHSKSGFRKYYRKANQFTQELNAAYGIEDAIGKVEGLDMGFELSGNEECEEGEDGLIRLEFTTYNEI